MEDIIYQKLQKLIKNYNVIINRKNFYEQPIDSDIKLYEEIIQKNYEEIIQLHIY